MGGIALTVATASAGVWLLAGLLRLRPTVVAAARSATLVLTFVAAASLAASLVAVAPELRYVSEHSSRSTPVPYRIAGLWGGMEGSLLFWSLLVVATTVCGERWARRADSRQAVAVDLTGATLVTAFLVVTRFLASPFERLAVPTGAGRGLLAVLQNPAMVYHPPILYTGLVLLLVPFGITAGAAWNRSLDRAWARATTPWLRASWLILALGMLTGSRWAYAELGWGGFWAWDPVENAALLPWLATTIALHLIADVRRSEDQAATSAGAISAAFLLMLVGVYVTRSGGTGSIHAFAESVDVGRALLVMSLVATVVVVIGLMRVVTTDSRRSESPFSVARWRRSRLLTAHAVVVGIATLAIAAGTFVPVIDSVFGDRRAVVTPRYYERVLPVLLITALVLMSVGPAVRWAGGTRHPRRLAIGAAIGVVSGSLTVGLIGTDSAGATGVAVLIAAAGSVGAVVGAGSAMVGRRHLGVMCAHAGFAIVMAGGAATSFGTDTQYRLALGGDETGVEASAGPSDIELLSLRADAADRYQFIEAEVSVDGQRYHPQRRAYEDQTTPTTEAAISSNLFRDVIVVIDVVDDDLRGAVVTVRTRPMAAWVWIGTLVMLGGGLLASVASQTRGSTNGPGSRQRRAARARLQPTPTTTEAPRPTNQQ